MVGILAVLPPAALGQFRHGFENTMFVRPAALDAPLRNPLMGFTTSNVQAGSNLHEWATLAHVYFRWNELENSAQDGLDKILALSDQRFAQAAANNIKVIPRVYLHWDGDEKYWPADMQVDDYSSAQFQQRVTRLVQRLGQAWNGDSRVAFVELGIFGKWGEHHSPSPSPAMQQLVGAAFHAAFPDKEVMVRHAWNEFRGFGFGEYWDSWGHYQQMWPHGQPIALANRDDDLHLHSVVGGEVAYNWGLWRTQPGDDPTDSVIDPLHREFLKNTIRWLHATQLRWISEYDPRNAAARAGAAELQRVMGYRFQIEGVEFTHRPRNGRLQVSLMVSNQGSAPFYYDWPVEVALLDPQTRQPVWRGRLADADIRDWLPGSDWTAPEWETISVWPNTAIKAGWSSQPPRWARPPSLHQVSGEFAVSVPPGRYVLALAVLDPAGNLPSLRFATRNYWNGGRHPVGMVAIGVDGGGPLPANTVFDDPAADRSLRYEVIRP